MTRHRSLPALTLGALGVVYGDIGTSPLYALREGFSGSHPVPVSPDNVLGVLSLIFWALILIISIKYLSFVMRADNRGEGGILALLALVRHREGTRRWLLVALGIFGAALLYGDGMITPAISVLSALEGLNVATPVFTPYVVPLTIAVLVALFLVQRRGTGGISVVFGPITLLWFLCLAALGISGIVRQPAVLAALNPWRGVHFVLFGGLHSFLVLGAVFLVVTGGEALYADMGHFGRRPIRVAWFALVLPALVLNYFGQGALLLHDPSAGVNPFYRLVPGWALYPMVGLATAATVIASQAVISGAFSLTRQAVQLGYSPRVTIVHTSEREIGQIYVPRVNWLLMGSTIALVLWFRASSNLAAAYGVAVTTTMVITTLLAFVVARERWGWRIWMAALMAGTFLTVELAFFAANIVKVREGGWLPLAVGALVYLVMSTWKEGRAAVAENFRQRALPVDLFVQDIAHTRPPRVPGTAVFMTGSAEGVPAVLLHHLKHNKLLHERVVLLSILTDEVPDVPALDRVTVEDLGAGLYRVVARYGFMQDPSMADIVGLAKLKGLDLKEMQTSFYLGRDTLLTTGRRGMARWRKQLFAFMARNARPATAYFKIPPNRVVELGAQIEL